jgi:hypothetical protein
VAIVGEAYEITASDNLTMLERPGVLRLRYDAIASAAFVVDTIAIYRWDFGTATWQALPSERDEETQEVVTPINELGLYALLGTPLPSKIAVLGAAEADIKCGSGLLKNYLPLILKN